MTRLTSALLSLMLVSVAGFLLSPEAGAQQFKSTNLQFHYNFGKEIYKADPIFYGPSLTAEHFGTDRYGEMLVHVDADLGQQGIADTRWTIARDLKFWDAPIALHGEYRGGLTRVADRPRVENAYVAGLDYVYTNSAKDLKLNFVAGYRYNQNAAKPHGLQLSGYWQWTSWNRLWSLIGYVNAYTTQTGNEEMAIAFQAEPQFWLNINQFAGVSDAFDLSVGIEGRMYYNVFMPKRFLAMPTLALKWNF